MITNMLPEGIENDRIDQIPQLTRDGLKYGLASLQIAGWQRGGHDNWYPYYEPDHLSSTDGRLTWGEALSQGGGAAVISQCGGADSP